ncbi:MAG: right-handed parallel beta-helix repeat-containing protein [Planctomycetota bacterium]
MTQTFPRIVPLLALLAVTACSSGSSSNDNSAENAAISIDPVLAGDLEQIQQQINEAPSGATVMIGAGQFAGRLVVRKPLILVGQGSATVLTGSPGLEAAAVEVRSTVGVEIRDLHVAAPYGGVRVRDCEDVLVQGVHASTCGGAGLEVRESTGVTLRDCDATDNLDYGVRIREAAVDVVVADCLVSGNVDHGVLIRDAVNVTLETSVVRDNAGSGVRLRDSSGVTVFDNDIENNLEYGVRIENTPVDPAALPVDNRITGNVQGEVFVEQP